MTTNKMPRKTDSQSVTNALLDQKLSTLTDNVNKLAITVAEGFKETHAKQSYTNGRVGEQEQKIIKLEEKFKYMNIIWTLFTAALGVITYFMTKGT